MLKMTFFHKFLQNLGNPYDVELIGRLFIRTKLMYVKMAKTSLHQQKIFEPGLFFNTQGACYKPKQKKIICM